MANIVDGRPRGDEAGSISREDARRPKVALINSIVARNDAISASVVDTYRALIENDAYRVSLFSYKNEYEQVPCHVVSNVNDLLYHPDYLDADILLWHFGITYDLFNATLIGNGRAPRIVRFHNVTPKEFVHRKSWQTIERSLVQCHLLRSVEEVWADSRVNAEMARDLGVDPSRIRGLPLVVEGGPVLAPSDKVAGPITILFVGRFVVAKGVLELLTAIERLHRRGTSVPFRLELAGNVDFSDPAYVAEIRTFIEKNALADTVTMHGTVSDEKLARLYTEAHILAIPSYHEGFCKPVVEALRAGCIPVGYSAYNLPYVANGFGRLVRPGDVDGLEAALRQIIEALPGAIKSPRATRLTLDMGRVSLTSLAAKVKGYIGQFSFDRIGAEMRERLRQISPRDM